MTSTRCSLIDRTNFPTLASLIINIHSFCSSFFFIIKNSSTLVNKNADIPENPLETNSAGQFQFLDVSVYIEHIRFTQGICIRSSPMSRTRTSNLRISRMRSLGCSSMPRQMRRLHQTGKETKSLCGPSTSIKIFPKSRNSLIVL